MLHLLWRIDAAVAHGDHHHSDLCKTYSVNPGESLGESRRREDTIFQS